MLCLKLGRVITDCSVVGPLGTLSVCRHRTDRLTDWLGTGVAKLDIYGIIKLLIQSGELKIRYIIFMSRIFHENSSIVFCLFVRQITSYKSKDFSCLFSYHIPIYCFCVRKIIGFFRDIDSNVNGYLDAAEQSLRIDKLMKSLCQLLPRKYCIYILWK